MNIKPMIINSAASVNFPICTVLNPAVLAVTDWKNAGSIAVFTSNASLPLPKKSITNISSAPVKIKARLVPSTTLA